MTRERGLNIGVFHALDFDRARKTSLNHCKYLEKYCPDNFYFYHHLNDPITASLRAMRFDVIILDVTFLCYRWSRPRKFFQDILEKYAFLAELDAVKAAFPQDEYDHGVILDEWLESWGVDLVWSVVWDGWDLFFPRTKKRARILRGLTGYVDDDDVERLSRYALPWKDRSIDVSYRARNLPPQFGRHGQLKRRLGEVFAEAVQGLPLATDISLRPDDVFLGDDWLKFLGNSKYVLGSEGGSSIWDPRGHLRDRVHAYQELHPLASYEEVEAACLASGIHEPAFSAISPRLFEVSAARAVQINVKAPFLGALEPWTHYLPLEPDLSNASAIAEALGDPRQASSMIEACEEVLIRPKTYRYSTHAREVMSTLLEEVEKRGLRPKVPLTELASAHAREIAELQRKVIPPLSKRLELELKRSIPRPLKALVRPARRWLFPVKVSPVAPPPVTPQQYWTDFNVTAHQVARDAAESLAMLDWRNAQYHPYLELMPTAGHDGRTILDYGCGPGHDLVGFSVHSKPHKLFGMDVSRTSLAEAKARLALHGANVELIRIEENEDRLPLDDASVDLVHSSGVLHHLANPLRVLRELRRVLKPDGEAQVMIYNYDSIFLHLWVAFENQLEAGKYRDLGVREAFRHCTDGPNCPISNVYTPAQWIALAREAGFEAEHRGNAVSIFEMSLLQKRFIAIQDPRLAKEHREFLLALHFDDRGYPMFDGQYAGIDGCYRLRRI